PRLTEFYRRVQQLVAVLPVFDSVNDFERRAVAAAEPRSTKHLDIDFRDRIRFERVTFDYGRSGQSPAVRAIDLEILAGSTTALVGPSGAGKSTIADLLIGLIG